MPRPPSGRQIELRCGRQRATVVEVGGGIRTYSVGGRNVLAGYGPDEVCPAARGQQLAPWPNRLRGGTYTWAREQHALPLDEPELGNAIHGLVRWRRWQVREVATSTATLRVRLSGEQGYPFALELTVTYALTDSGLRATATACNVGPQPCPFAHGAHPYLAVAGPVDRAILHLPARTYLPTDATLIPTGRAPVVGGPYDFREPRRIGTTAVDHTFTDLSRGADGCAEITVGGPDGARTVLWMDGGYPYVHVYTGDASEAGARLAGLAVEPMTAPPNAFATGEAVLSLEPRRPLGFSWGIRCDGP